MARPHIPDRLVEEVKQLHKQYRGYEASNVQEALATVTDMAKDAHPLNRPENSHFAYDIYDRGDRGIYLIISSRKESPIQLDGRTLKTETAQTTIPKSALNGIKKVKNVYENEDGLAGIDRVLSEEELVLHIQYIDENDASEIIDEIFTTLQEQIETAEDTVAQVERAASKYAVPKRDEE